MAAVIWGDDEPVFADEAQMQAVLGGILGRYNHKGLTRSGVAVRIQ